MASVSPLQRDRSPMSSGGFNHPTTPVGENIPLADAPTGVSDSAVALDSYDRSTSTSSYRRDGRESATSSTRRFSLTPAQTHLGVTRHSFHHTQPSGSFGGGPLPEALEDESNALDDYVPPVSTSRCLQHFDDVVRRTVDPKAEEEKKAKMNYYRGERAKHDKTLNQLRLWNESKKKRTTLAGFLTGLLQPMPSLPSQMDIVDLAKYHYPMRGNIPVYICDFGDNQFDKKEITIGEIQSCMLSASLLSPNQMLTL
jgi:hypothetical protein